MNFRGTQKSPGSPEAFAIPILLICRGLHSAALDELQYENNDRNNQQDVDQISDRCTRKTKAQSPKYQKNDNDRPKHVISSLD